MQTAFAMIQAVMPALAARISFQKRQQQNFPLTQPYIRRISNQLDGRKLKTRCRTCFALASLFICGHDSYLQAR